MTKAFCHQILSYLAACKRLSGLGYDRAQVEEALEMFQNSESKVTPPTHSGLENQRMCRAHWGNFIRGSEFKVEGRVQGRGQRWISTDKYQLHFCDIVLFFPSGCRVLASLDSVQ